MAATSRRRHQKPAALDDDGKRQHRAHEEGNHYRPALGEHSDQSADVMHEPLTAGWVRDPRWLLARCLSGQALGGWLDERLFGQDQLVRLGDVQPVFGAVVHDDDLPSAVEEIGARDAGRRGSAFPLRLVVRLLVTSALRTRRPRCAPPRPERRPGSGRRRSRWPAPQARETSPTVVAPAATVASIWRSETPRQRQTIMSGSGSPGRRWPALGERRGSVPRSPRRRRRRRPRGESAATGTRRAPRESRR